MNGYRPKSTEHPPVLQRDADTFTPARGTSSRTVSSSGFASLVAVAVQCRLNGLLHAFIECPRSAQVSLSFLGHSSLQVAGPRLAMLGVTIRGQAKTLLRPLVGFHLRHDRARIGR